MYIGFGLFFLLCIFFFLFQLWRRHRIIKYIRCMDLCQKLCTLNGLLQPFGFSYRSDQDIVTSLRDAWQRSFGYCTLFDRTTSRFHMVFDCEPVYFDYKGRTWRIEFWKGQYGINTGAEIGIYHADQILLPHQYDTAHFHSADDHELLRLGMQLSLQDNSLFSTCQEHWWLTGFRVGQFSRPEDLKLYLSITFPAFLMLQSFLAGLQRSGYQTGSFCVCGLTISICFMAPHAKQYRTIRAHLSQWSNRLFVSLYRLVTRPFTTTPDRLLYLYYFLPVAFRRTLRLCKNRRKKHE